MEFLGPLAFGAMTLVNLVVLGMVAAAILRKTRAHR
jgi:hypothetical protein